MPQEKIPPVDQWRWKIIKKVADYVNQPDDVNMAELKIMIEDYRTYHDIRSYIPENFN